MRVLISVSNKEGIVNFAKGLSEIGAEIISTDGTLRRLRDNGVDAKDVKDITGFSEFLGGRVKTLHPNIHGGILALRDNADHMNELSKKGIEPIDMVVCNLYPFREVMSNQDSSHEEIIENIDIGGPTMLRSAAKNYKSVLVVSDPCDYDLVLNNLKKDLVDEDFKLYLGKKAFSHTSSYDANISKYLGDIEKGEAFPEQVIFSYNKVMDLRYGENPHQRAAFYKDTIAHENSLSEAIQHSGKELSFNNINDGSSGVNLILEFDEPASVCLKHTNPCGVAVGYDIYNAYKNAYEADKVSIFGGVVVLNSHVDKKLADEISKIFLELIIAPSYSDEAIKVLSRRKSLRILELPNLALRPDEKRRLNRFDMKRVEGGLLMQYRDQNSIDEEERTVVTSRIPTDQEELDMKMGMKVAKHLKSNAIAIVKNGKTLGLSGGQVSRIDAVKNALGRDDVDYTDAVMASDAFFPFDDCIKLANEKGVLAVIQPGGSINDQKSIDMAEKLGMSMVFSHVRHFNH